MGSSFKFSQSSTDLLNNESILGSVVEDDYGALLFGSDIGAPRISRVTEDYDLVLVGIDFLKILHPRSYRRRLIVEEIVSRDVLESLIFRDPLLVVISGLVDGNDDGSVLESIFEGLKELVDLVILGVVDDRIDNWLWSYIKIEVESPHLPPRRYLEEKLGGLIDGGTESDELFDPGKGGGIGEKVFLLPLLGLDASISDHYVPEGIYLIGQDDKSFLILLDELGQSMSVEEVYVVDPSTILPNFGLHIDS